MGSCAAREREAAARIFLMTRHPGDPVVEDNRTDIAAVVDDVQQRRHAGIGRM